MRMATLDIGNTLSSDSQEIKTQRKHMKRIILSVLLVGVGAVAADFQANPVPALGLNAKD